jgi:hypothetical protein
VDGKKKKKTHENYHAFGKQAFILITMPLLKISAYLVQTVETCKTRMLY